MSFNDSSVNVLKGKIKNSLRDKQMRDYIRILADSVVQNNECQKRDRGSYLTPTPNFKNFLKGKKWNLK